MQTLEKTQQTSRTTRRPKRGTIQSWTWSQRSHKVNRAWSGKTKMHSCTSTSSRHHISLPVPVNNHTGTMHQLRIKIMEFSVQLYNNTRSQDSLRSKASSRMLIFSKRNLISYLLTSDLRPCRSSLELKSSLALNKLNRLRPKEGGATQCLVSSNLNQKHSGRIWQLKRRKRMSTLLDVSTCRSGPTKARLWQECAPLCLDASSSLRSIVNSKSTQER